MSNKRRTDSSDRRQTLEDLMMSSSPQYRRKTRLKLWAKVTFKIILLISLICGVVYSCLWLWNEYIEKNEDFMLKDIDFHTNGHMTEMEVKHILSLKGNENVLFLDTEILTEILKKRPDIVKASVRRKIPATLIIDIEERIPIAWIECPQCGIHARDEEKGLMVDASGYLFKYDTLLHSRYKSSPVLQVMAPADGVYEEGDWLEGRTTKRGLSFIKSLTPYYADGLPPAELIDLPDEWAILCQFSNGMEITFGSYDHDRQLHDLVIIMRYMESKQRKLLSANLVPSINTPIAYVAEGEAGSPANQVVEAEIIIEADPVLPPERPVANTGTARTPSPAPQRSGTTANQSSSRNNSASSSKLTVRETNSRPASRNTRQQAASSSNKPKASSNTSRQNNRQAPRRQNPPPNQNQQKQQQKPQEKKPVEVPTFMW